jgi:outer membrane protein OmpA-like peptidoglycan-associated protein
MPNTFEHGRITCLEPIRDLLVDPTIRVVGWPGRRLEQPLLSGDVAIRQPLGAPRRSYILTGAPSLSGRLEVQAFAVEGGRTTTLNLCGPDGLLRGDLTIVRPLASSEAAEIAAETTPVSRPTIRSGSRGPAVIDAQQRLNRVHVLQLAAGAPAIAGCPLVVDGIFGQNTRKATVSFQRLAFPGQPTEWDGVIGPHTWTALLARSDGGDSQITLPRTCPGLPLRQDIDQFEFNSAKVLPRHQPQIVGIARCIVESQRTATPIRHLHLVGHTDPVGSDPENVALGLRRAEAVRQEILAAVARISGNPALAAGLVIDVDSRGERERRASDGESRRVEVISDFAFDPVKPVPPPPPPVAAATIEFVLDHDNDRVVDAAAPVATAVMFGLWDDAYTGGNIRNGASPADSFVDRDRRRFYLRVTDPAATAATVTADWRTVDGAGANDDAPAVQSITLTRAAKGVYVSRALILVTNAVDLALEVHSGLTAGASAGLRRRGQSDFRLRRASLEGSAVAEYRPASGAIATVTRPVFQRKPDLRRRLKLGIVHYGITPDAAITRYINAQIERARIRWMQTGLHIEKGKSIDRAIVASARDGAGNYIGTRLSQEEADACNDLMTVIPDKTVTVCFTRFPLTRPVGVVPFNAYATRGFSPRMDLRERFFIFINLDLDIDNDTLAHELHHVIHNRGDEDSLDQFFTFNTSPPDDIPRVVAGTITLPDARIYHRVHVEHGNPDNDPRVECTANWMRRRRTRRYNPPGNTHPRGFSAADASTGNILTESF